MNFLKRSSPNFLSCNLLSLQNNSLTALPERIFRGLSRLQQLSLSHNTLSALPEGIFANLSQLQELWLDNNRLSALPEGVFVGLSQLQQLGLEGNGLDLSVLQCVQRNLSCVACQCN